MASFFADCPPADPIAPAPEPPAGVSLTAGSITLDAQIDSTDVEYVCNSTTGVYDVITTAIVGGVAQAPTVAATAIPCDQASSTTQDIEYICNPTSGNYDVVVTPIVAGIAGTPTVTDSGLPCGGASSAPSFSELRFECACDQAADGSITAAFWRAYTIEIDDTGTPQTSEIGDGWTDNLFTAPYTVLGTEVDCAEAGDGVYGVEAHKHDLNAGESWSAPALTQTIGVAVVGNGATVTDSDGTVTPLTNSRGYSWYAVDGSHFIKTPFTIDAGSADVEITYTVLTSA